MKMLRSSPALTDRMIITPFNKNFIVTLAVFILLLVFLVMVLKNTCETTRRIVLASVYFGGFVIFIVYKIFLSLDEPYAAILAENGKGGFSWWTELPLQLCNINLMLVPVSVLTKKRPLMAFCFFMSPIGALMALLMPAVGFSGYSLFLPRMLGYYITHFMVLLGGPALAALGLYRPAYRDVIPTAVTALLVSFVIFLINELLIHTGANVYANYFYNVSTEGNPILELVWKWIPVPYVYQLPLVAVLLPYLLIVTFFFELAAKRNRIE